MYSACALGHGTTHTHAPVAGPRPQAYLLRKATRYVSFVLSCFGIVEPVHDRGEGLRGDEATGGTSQLAQGVLDVLTGFRDAVKSAARGGVRGRRCWVLCSTHAMDAWSLLCVSLDCVPRPKHAAHTPPVRCASVAPPPPSQADARALLSLCDDLRDQQLVPLGVQLEDRPDGTASWKLEDPVALAAAAAARSREAGAARLKKLQAAVRLKRAEVEKFEKLAALPSAREALGEKYKGFDEATGVPTHDKDGVPLEGKALAKAAKEWEKQRAIRVPLEKRVAEEGEGFMEALQQQLQALEAEARALESCAT